MKRKLLITTSLISLLLVLFPVSLYAEGDVEDIEELSGVDLPSYALDDYFYTNYNLLPYIESDGSQYINTQIIPDDYTEFHMVIRNIDASSNNKYIMGEYSSSYAYMINIVKSGTDGFLNFSFGSSNYRNNLNIAESDLIYYIDYKNNIFRVNGSSVNVNDGTVTATAPIYVFDRNYHDGGSSYQLLSMYIYDSDQEEYLRYFYPAQAKSSGTVGLYDSVSKTFFPSLGDPFESPIDTSNNIYADVSMFVTSGITWIGNIFTFVIDQPMILFFMAVGLAGAMYRWARRLVHF